MTEKHSTTTTTGDPRRALEPNETDTCVGGPATTLAVTAPDATDRGRKVKSGSCCGALVV